MINNKINQTLFLLMPAAGNGTRMQSTIKKQYLKINGKSILEHSINKFLSLDLINHLFIGINQNDINTLEYLNNKKITQVIGDKERYLTVYNLLLEANKFHKNNYKEDTQAWVIIHDAARPLIHQQDIINLWNNRNPQGSILATQAKDTIKYSNHSKQIEKTLDRNNIWQAQTPQLFPMNFLLKCYEHIFTNNINVNNLTDEASIVEQCGYNSYLVQSQFCNIKITTPDDLQIVELFLNQIK